MSDIFKSKTELGITEVQSTSKRVDPEDNGKKKFGINPILNGIKHSCIGRYIAAETETLVEVFSCPYREHGRKRISGSVCNIKIMRRVSDGFYNISGEHDNNCHINDRVAIPPAKPKDKKLSRLDKLNISILEERKLEIKMTIEEDIDDIDKLITGIKRPRDLDNDTQTIRIQRQKRRKK